jgi:Cu-Zn family superoxide dismutase
VHEDDTNIAQAVAVMNPTEGSDTRGVVTFTRTETGISVVADMVGLEPGPHGFHIHEFGDCSATDGTSAGGHFNPTGAEHAGPEDSERHVGDLGNITADEDSTAHHEIVDAHITFSGPNSIIGRGVIVHADADDLTSQPTGAAGARVACGVVGIARQ